MSAKKIDGLLLFLIALDVALSIVSLGFPELWFQIFHGTELVDPQGLLRRTGGTWVAFTLLQIIAYRKWRAQPYWLPLVAGVRLTELFSDWIYLAIAQQTTLFAKLGLFVAPPANVLFAVILLRGYSISRSKGWDSVR